MIFERARPISSFVMAFGFATLAGCITPGAERIIGPDGSPMLHVSCGADQSQCFRLAGERCPNGYEYAPVYDSKDGNFFVRCKNPVAALYAAPTATALATPAPAPAPVPTHATPSPAPRPQPSAPATSGDWPPGEVGRATEPWNKEPSSAVSGGVPGAALPPTPRTKLGEVDIGY